MIRNLIKSFALTLGLLSVCLTANAQSITLNLERVTVKQAIEEIRNSYGYSFVYEARDLNTKKIITVKLSDATIEEAVRAVVADQPVTFEIKGKNIIISRTNSERPTKKSEKLTVTGTVVDAAGVPIVGASVTDDGAFSVGTTSDVKGHFTIATTSGATLSISYLGYVSQETRVGNQTNIKIVLQEDVTVVQEVVVIGYGSQKRENLTGAVATLDAKSVENRSVSTISQALQGTVGNLNISPNASNTSSDWDSAGGAPGAAQSINIRGYTGFDTNGNALSESPLIVIDGVQGGDLNTINMNDVESVTVLKDAASAAIYGSSAPFGVILITTKKGGVGQKTTISYNNNLMFSQPINMPQMMNSLDYAMAFNQFSTNANTARLYNASTLQRIIEYLNGTRTTETIADELTDSWLSGFSGNANNNWFDIMFKKWSFSQSHNLGVSGGTKNTSYYMGIGYLDQEGMYTYGNDYFKRYNARTTLQTEITKWLTVGFRGAFSRGEKNTPNSAAFYNANILHMVAQRRPTQPLYNPDGNYAQGSLVPSFLNGGRINNVADEAQLVGEVIMRPAKGWDVVANYAFTGGYTNRMSHLATVYHTRPSGKQGTFEGTTPNSLTRRMGQSERHLVNAYTSYERQLGDHYMKYMVGYMQELYDNFYLQGSNNQLYSDNILSLSTTYGTSISATDLEEQIATRGVFGRINYNYKERYLLEFNGRYDGTSRFMTNVRYKFYPGVSGAWVVSKENFWEPLTNAVNLFKFRASYGSQGSQGSAGYYPFYPALRTYSPTASTNNYLFSTGQDPMVTYPSSLVDPNLTWVTTETIDFGADMSFLNNRLNVSYDWYRRTASDYQGPAETLPAILGTSAPLTNNAAMQTTGFEFTLKWRHNIGKVNYSIDFVLSDYTSIITKYPNPTKTTITGLGTTYKYVWYEGARLGDIWGFETVGLFRSQEEIDNSADQSLLNSKAWTVGDVRYADLDGDGKITWGDNTLDNPGDRKVIGNTTPRYSYGVTLSADWNGFDCKVFLQGVAKRDSPANHNTGEYRFANYVWGVVRQGSYAQSTMWVDQHNRWSEYNTAAENAKAYYPKFYFSDENMKNTYEQTRYMQNAAYARLKNIQVGYTFPQRLTKRFFVQNLRIYANVENAYTWTKMISTLDPEFSTSDGKLYPLQRVWAFGCSVTF